MTIMRALNKLFDLATELALAAAIAIAFAAFAWHCIGEVWHKGGPLAPAATLAMAFAGLVLVLNAGNLASALLQGVTSDSKPSEPRN